MRKLSTIAVALALLAGCGGSSESESEDYQGADGQRQYCEDIGADYDDKLNTCKVRDDG